MGGWVELGEESELGEGDLWVELGGVGRSLD